MKKLMIAFAAGLVSALTFAAQLAGKRFFKIPPRQAGGRNDILRICSPEKGGLAWPGPEGAEAGAAL